MKFQTTPALLLLLLGESAFSFTLCPVLKTGRVAFVSNDRVSSCSPGFVKTPLYSEDLETAETQEVEAATDDDADEVEAESAEEEEDSSEEDAAESDEDASEPEVEDVKVYIGNLPFEQTEEQVRAMFDPFGQVNEIVLPLNRDNGLIRGFGFVSMPNMEEAEKAIEALNESTVEGRTVYVNEAGKPGTRPPRKESQPRTKLYVGNLSFYTEPQDLAEYFEQYGTVHDCYMPADRESGRPRGFGFVTMDASDAETAIENADGEEFDGRILRVNKSLAKGEKRPPKTYEEPDGRKLYVGNLSFDTEEVTLRSVFEEYGSIVECFMPLDRDTGRPRGFAFVTMAPEDAEKALEVDGLELDGRVIRVNDAQPRPQYGSGGGGGYGGGDDFGGDSWDADDDGSGY